MTQALVHSKLVLIGGGPIPETVTEEILRLARGQDSRVVICSWASQHSDTGTRTAENLFRKRHGCSQIKVFDEGPRRKVEDLRCIADSESSLGILEDCDVFFFTGGDQRVLLGALQGTLFERRLRELWQAGQIVIAGTSAGLQIHSELALTGEFKEDEELVNVTQDEIRCTRIATQNVGVVPGLGLLCGVILDQHFVKRQRQNRLISVVLDHPQHVGIGVDEATALVFDGKSGQYVLPRVVGESCVFYVNAREAGMRFGKTGKLNRVANLDCGVVWEGAEWPFPILLA